MKKQLRKQWLTVTILFTVILLLGACKKNSDGPPSTAQDRFPLTGLKATITKTEPSSNSPYINITYEVKNISTANYAAGYTAGGVYVAIYIRFTIFATDGTSYENTNVVPDIQAGKTAVKSIPVDYSAGKTIDLSKTKYELYYR